MAPRKTTKTSTPPPPPASVPCPVCQGSGEVSRPVQVGRKRRTVGRQTGICLGCLGAGEVPATD
jgi:DnaJ-class molecular chaperone